MTSDGQKLHLAVPQIGQNPKWGPASTQVASRWPGQGWADPLPIDASVSDQLLQCSYKGKKKEFSSTHKMTKRWCTVVKIFFLALFSDLPISLEDDTNEVGISKEKLITR